MRLSAAFFRLLSWFLPSEKGLVMPLGGRISDLRHEKGFCRIKISPSRPSLIRACATGVVKEFDKGEKVLIISSGGEEIKIQYFDDRGLFLCKKRGDRVEAGEVIGFLFSCSLCEINLPEKARLQVKKGERVFGGRVYFHLPLLD